jgi:OHS family lactose permease-like MFS transporter
MTARQSNFRFLCSYVFIYFFAQAMSISLLSLWFGSTLKLSGAETGLVFGINSMAAMCAQPIYGFMSDRIGARKHILWLVGGMVSLCALFFVFVYGPLLKANLMLGAIVGAAYLGVTFMAGSYAIESYVDRIGRRDGFEYSRVRLWGSLGFASAAMFSGRLFNINPDINFALASGAGVLMLVLLLVWHSTGSAAAPAAEHNAPARVSLAEALGLLRDPNFWRFMVFILGVTNLYLLFDQRFASYFAGMFSDPKTGTAMFGYLNSVQIFVEAAGLFVAPLLVKRIGAKNGLLLAGAIMMIRIAGSGLAVGPLSISCMKMLHSVELPILVVSVFRYIAANFDNRLASTLYMVGVSFGHSLGLTILSPLAGLSYDRIGYSATYFLLAALGVVFLALSAWFLTPTAPEIPFRKNGAPLPDAARSTT